MIDDPKILNDEALPLDEYPDTYLAPNAKDADKYRKNSNIFQEIFDMFKNLDWRDIKFESMRGGSMQTEVPILPAELRKKIKQAYKFDEHKAETSFSSGGQAFAKTWNGDHLNREDDIFMQVEGVGGIQRSHFPGDGLPGALRGMRLGYKLYRALLEKYKYLSSNSSGTDEKDRVWQSIISPKKDKRGKLTADDVHSILGPDYVFAMVKNIPERKKIEFAKRFIDKVVMEEDPESVTKKSFGIDAELKEILPDDVLLNVDPERRKEKRELDLKRRYDKFAPLGPTNYSWKLGDYVVVKDDIKDLDDEDNIVTRKVVSRDEEDGKWLAIKIDDLAGYERNGDSGDAEVTTRKSDWIKTVLPRGTTDPTAGRIPVRGTRHQEPRAPRVNRREGVNRQAIKGFIDSGGYELYGEKEQWRNNDSDFFNRPRPAILVKKFRDGRSFKFTIMNGQTGEVKDLNRQEFSRKYVKLSQEPISSKTDVEEDDWVFIRDHRTYAGLITSVYRITPAENRQPGIYLRVGEDRPLYISDPETLDKVEMSNESFRFDGIPLFEDFKGCTMKKLKPFDDFKGDI